MTVSLAELGEISKAKHKDDVGEDYRASRFQRINPRSRTYVKEGTMPQRIGRPLVGGVAGNIAGGAVGAGLGAITRKPGAVSRGGALGAALGTPAGATVGYHHNIKSKDTVAFHRKTGKRAKSKADIPYLGTYNIY